MSAIDGLPHTWGQTFVSGGDALVRVYGGALNVNRHLGGGGKGYLPDPHGHGSNDTHLLGTLPGCRHDFCLEKWLLQSAPAEKLSNVKTEQRNK